MRRPAPLLVLGLLACRKGPEEPSPVARVDAPEVATPPQTFAWLPHRERPCPKGDASSLVRLAVQFEEPRGAVFHVELARTHDEHAVGLMFRTALGSDEGMLFRMPERRVHEFWMRNTCIPLDMIFLEDDGTVVGVVDGAVPLDETPRSVARASRWVLELNAGTAKARGIGSGSRLAIPPEARR